MCIESNPVCRRAAEAFAASDAAMESLIREEEQETAQIAAKKLKRKNAKKAKKSRADLKVC